LPAQTPGQAVGLRDPKGSEQGTAIRRTRPSLRTILHTRTRSYQIPFAQFGQSIPASVRFHPNALASGYISASPTAFQAKRFGHRSACHGQLIPALKTAINRFHLRRPPLSNTPIVSRINAPIPTYSKISIVPELMPNAWEI
jgi:hypothetical protein